MTAWSQQIFTEQAVKRQPRHTISRVCKTEDEPFAFSLEILPCSQVTCGDREFTIKHTALSRIKMKS